ncbi:hypothetical protein [Coleofasciculus sp. FACHB-1120]|uniref:hypothetical protein n=1 Tax=Coleofasciculus sp. FACHB-1120 TaxID=2692783 RepID=UPI001683DFB9|nr:hypothetical protein [Coleofasciculus sp. FACHB-1120]MBD2740554.1 hypothetical protein [Coleofasciculus sp. FACHB-1120]
MSQLKIDDLSFCENQLSSNSEVQGGRGITVSSPSGRSSWSASADSAHSAGYFTDSFFDKSTGNFGYVIGAGYSASVSGAAAGALADGSTYASSFAGAGTF